jgi:hypothetical protein
MFDSMAWGTSVDAPSIKLSPMSLDESVTYVCGPYPRAPNKSLQRSGGRWYLVCKALAVLDKVPMLGLGEPPGAELSR